MNKKIITGFIFLLFAAILVVIGAQFKSKPVTQTLPNSSQIMVGFNETSTPAGVTIQPLVLVEDSRCPKNVNCVWAGTVKIKARVSDGSSSEEKILTLGSELTFYGKFITFESVEPPKESSENIEPKEYRFSFTVLMR